MIDQPREVGMQLGGTSEDREAKRQEKQQRQTAAGQEKANQEWWQSPVGQSHQAKERGDGFFQCEITISQLQGWASGFGSASNRVQSTGGKPDMLAQIESYGWRLEHVGYVFVQTGATSTDRAFSSGQGTVVRGNVTGIYLFRALT